MFWGMGFPRVAEGTQSRRDYLLGIGLPRIHHVEDFVGVAERRRACVAALACGDPGFVSVRVRVKPLVVKIAVEEAELPEVVGDVLSDVCDRAIGSDDDFGFGLLGGLVVCLVVCVIRGFWLAFFCLAVRW